MNFFASERLLNTRFLKASLLLFFVPLCFLSQAQSQARPKLSIQLLLSANPGSENTADGAVAFFDDRFSYSIGNEDSYKWTNPDENLAINCRGTLLSIDGQPGLHDSDTLNLSMWQYRQKSYYLKLVASNFSPAVKTFLKDNYLHTETSVELSSPVYLPFSISSDDASFAADRFAIIFKIVKPADQNNAAKFRSGFKENLSLSVFPNPLKRNEIKLQMKNMQIGSYIVSLYTNDGEMMYSGFITHNGSSAAKTIVIDRRIRKGMYSLLLTYGDQTIKKDVLF